MFQFKKIIINSKAFFIPVLCFLAGGAMIHFIMPYDAISLEVNKRYTHTYNHFFTYITLLGDGFFVVAFGFLIRFVQKQISQKILLTYLMTSMLCSFLKQWVFKGLPRPIEHFSELYPVLNLIDGIQLSRWNTFPSGHSAAAFMLFTILSIWIRNPLVQMLFAFLAILTGFSRVYLFQHFLRDVMAGALMGCFFALLTEFLFHRWSVSDESRPISDK